LPAKIEAGLPKRTKRLVEGAMASARDRFLWDEALNGFGLKVSPAGRRTDHLPE
jgi:hypothetical protein